jgi:hypothetical protein
MFVLSCRRYVPALALVVGIAACSGGMGSPSSPPTSAAQFTLPASASPVGIRRLDLEARIMPPKKSNLIYASNISGEDVDGWPNPNNRNLDAICAIGAPYEPLDGVEGFAVDPHGYLVVPATTSGGYYVSVWKPNCSARVWQAEIPSTEKPFDAYSDNAATGIVAVAVTRQGYSNVSGIVLCSESTGCGSPITNPAVRDAFGVAMAKNGDCWLEASGPSLFYFHKCSGSGKLATGTMNAETGGLFIDTQGHLGSIDPSGMLWVYSGCKPACSLVSKSTLIGTPQYGGLDAKGKYLAVGDPIGSGPKVDVYSYSPTSGATYSYSFNNTVGTPYAAHFAPRNEKT